MASRKFLVPANLLNLDVDPTSGTSGDIYFNTTSDKLRIHDGTSWINVGGGSSITVSQTAPVDPVIGSGWFDNVTGDFFIYDGSFWVEVNGTIENPPLTQEEIQDYAAPLLNHANHENVTATYDDLNNQIILTASASGGSEIIVSDVNTCSCLIVSNIKLF